MTVPERLVGTVELLEMILLALPLRDMLLVREVSRTCRALIDESTVLKNIRENPAVVAKLILPFECSKSLPTGPELHVDPVLHYDRPVTVRRIVSPLDGPSNLTYRYAQGDPVPQEFPPELIGGRSRPPALWLSRENDWKYITLLPGTPFRLSYNFGVRRRKPEFEHMGPISQGFTSLDVDETYVLGVTPGRNLPAFVGTKRSLLEKSDEGDDLKKYGFHEVHGVRGGGAVGKALPVIGEDTILFRVVE